MSHEHEWRSPQVHGEEPREVCLVCSIERAPEPPTVEIRDDRRPWWQRLWAKVAE